MTAVAPAQWELVDAHRCTACGHLETDGYRMVEHLRTHNEPPAAVWRSRCLLAQSILNQRATADGLSRDDAAAVAGALVGVWDRP
jgi:hypothetical protein